MPDQFEVQRQLDHPADEQVESLMEELEEDKDKARLRSQRLIPLDESHYFDPQDKWVLFKDGSQFKKLDHVPVQFKGRVEEIEGEVLNKKFNPIQGA